MKVRPRGDLVPPWRSVITFFKLTNGTKSHKISHLYPLHLFFVYNIRYSSLPHFWRISSFYTPWKHQKPYVFSCFQGASNGNIGQKQVNVKLSLMSFIFKKSVLFVWYLIDLVFYGECPFSGDLKIRQFLIQAKLTISNLNYYYAQQTLRVELVSVVDFYKVHMIISNQLLYS